MSQHGQDTPVIVETFEGKYRLRAGFRRCAAAKRILGWEELEAQIMEFTSEEEAKLLNARENLERLNLTYYEECCALRDIFPLTTEMSYIARLLSKSRTWVRARWLVWDLPPEILLGVEIGELTQVDVIRLIGRTHEEQRVIVQKIIQGKEQGLSQGEIDVTLGKLSRKTKKEIERMATIMLEQSQHEERLALLWVIGVIDDEELTYRGSKSGE